MDDGLSTLRVDEQVYYIVEMAYQLLPTGNRARM